MNRSPYTWTTPAGTLVRLRYRRLMRVMAELGCADGAREWVLSYMAGVPTFR